MPAISRINDSINGMTDGEHNGHYDIDGNPIHGPCSLSGEIISNCSPNVFANSKNVAVQGSLTLESDCCDSGKSGTVNIGSGSVFVNGKSVARVNDTIAPHNGTASITGGSPNVFVGN